MWDWSESAPEPYNANWKHPRVCHDTPWRAPCDRRAKWIVALPFLDPVYVCGIHRRAYNMNVCYRLRD